MTKGSPLCAARAGSWAAHSGEPFVCRQGRELGFDGKTLIHPKTIAAANAAFSPREEDIAWARKIAEAHGAAMAEGKGVLQVDGKLVEGLHVAEAQRLVAMADMIAEIEGAQG